MCGLRPMCLCMLCDHVSLLNCNLKHVHVLCISIDRYDMSYICVHTCLKGISTRQGVETPVLLLHQRSWQYPVRISVPDAELTYLLYIFELLTSCPIRCCALGSSCSQNKIFNIFKFSNFATFPVIAFFNSPSQGGLHSDPSSCEQPSKCVSESH